MIVRRTWERHSRDHDGISTVWYRDVYTGWFLFGIVPIFISRERNRR